MYMTEVARAEHFESNPASWKPLRVRPSERNFQADPMHMRVPPRCLFDDACAAMDAADVQYGSINSGVRYVVLEVEVMDQYCLPGESTKAIRIIAVVGAFAPKPFRGF